MLKKLLIRISLLLIFDILAILSPNTGVLYAYVINTTPSGKPIDWTYKAKPMGENYLVNENCADCTGEAAGIQRAANTWNKAGAKFSFSYGGATTVVDPSNDGINTISWSSTYFPTGSTMLAETSYWYDTNTGNILECDCVFNDNKSWSTAATTPNNQFDLESVMLHELGHFLGLGHPVPQAVMQPNIPNGTQRRTLTADDKAGIIAIYGRRPTNKTAPLLFLLLQ